MSIPVDEPPLPISTNHNGLGCHKILDLFPPQDPLFGTKIESNPTRTVIETISSITSDKLCNYVGTIPIDPI